ncbi:MAG: hypothetical protein EA411_12635 [Saprospirales bacterium]|nr:MAG: hypothetical protein EA411_12635 [Saprospirales bacterium]
MKKFNEINWEKNGPDGIEKHIHPRLPDRVLSARVNFLWEKHGEVAFDWDTILGFSGKSLILFDKTEPLLQFALGCFKKRDSGWTLLCNQSLPHLFNLWNHRGEFKKLKVAVKDLANNCFPDQHALLLNALLRLLANLENEFVSDIAISLSQDAKFDQTSVEFQRFIEHTCFGLALEESLNAFERGETASPTSYFNNSYRGKSLYENTRMWVMLSTVKRELDPDAILSNAFKGDDKHLGSVQVAFMKYAKSRLRIPFALSIHTWRMAEQLFYNAPKRKKFYYFAMLDLENDSLLDFAFDGDSGVDHLLYITQIWSFPHLFAFLVEKGLIPDARIYELRNYSWKIQRRLILDNEDYLLPYSFLRFIPPDPDLKKGFDMESLLEDALKPNSARCKNLIKELRDFEDFNELYFSKMPTRDFLLEE